MRQVWRDASLGRTNPPTLAERLKKGAQTRCYPVKNRTSPSPNVNPDSNKLARQGGWVFLDFEIEDDPKEAQELLLIPAERVAELLQISKRTLWRILSAGKLPEPLQIGGVARWNWPDIRTLSRR